MCRAPSSTPRPGDESDRSAIRQAGVTSRQFALVLDLAQERQTSFGSLLRTIEIEHDGLAVQS